MKYVLRKHTIAALAMVLTAFAGRATAQQAASASPAPQDPDRYVVGRALPPETPGTTSLNLTLEDATQIALEKNINLKSARLTPQNLDYQLQSARAAFMPRYSTTYNYNTNSNPSNNTNEGVSVVTQGTQNFNATVNQLLPWYGSTFAANFTNSRATSNALNARLPLAYNSRVQLAYTMPVLAGFKIDNARNQLRTLTVQRQIADIQLVTQIENTKADVRVAYWNLRQSIEQIEIGRRALQLAQRLFEDNRIKVEIGTLAPIETTQSETAVAQAEQTLLAAEIAWRTSELNLKRLLAESPTDSIYQNTIVPTEQAALSAQSVDIPAAVKNALSQRTDLVERRRNLDVSRLNLEVTRNLTKPQLDFNAGYNTSGQAGRELQQGVVVAENNYFDALNALRNLNTIGWNVGFTFAVPVGRDMTQRKVDLARALITLQQSELTLQNQELTVSSDVTNAGLAVENTYKQYQAALKAREAQERNTEAASVRFDVGVATNFEVVQAQQQLTTQRLAELRSLISYLNAIAEFDRIQRVGR